MNESQESNTQQKAVASDALFGLTVAIDFDGTCVTHEYPKVGRYIGAQPVLQRIVAEGGKLILWTMRSDQGLQDAVDWFEAHGIPLYGIQRNPTQDEWTNSPKCYAKLYIDDAALGCPLLPGLKGERPFVDWKAISEIFGRTQKPICGRKIKAYENKTTK